MECVYCKHKFVSNSCLIQHQKTAKYCLKLREPTEIDKTFICEYCKKIFTLKSSFDRHKLVCKCRGNELQIIISRLQEENISIKNHLQECQHREQLLREDYSKVVDTLAKKSTVTTINNLNMGVFDKTPNDIKRIVDENYDRSYLVQGQKGVAKFTTKHVLENGENTRPIYVITDKSRGNGKYKISETEIVSDPKMAGLTKRVHPSIKKKAINITSEQPNFLEDEELMAGYHEVFEMDEDNTIFRNIMVQELGS